MWGRTTAHTAPTASGRASRTAAWCSCSTALWPWGVIFFIKPYAVELVLGDADPAVAAGAIQYLSVMSMLFCFHGLLMIFRNTLQGLGYSVLAIVSGVGELIGRSLGGVLAVKTSLGYLGICLSNPFAWALAMFYCLFMVCRILRREKQTET